MKHGDLATRLGVTPAKLRELRAEHLRREEWHKAGTSVYYTLSAIQKLQALQVVKPEAPEAVPVFVDCYVIKPARNPTFVRCALHEESGEVSQVMVRIPQRLLRFMIKGKRIRAQRVTTGGQDFFRHESLCR